MKSVPIHTTPTSLYYFCLSICFVWNIGSFLKLVEDSMKTGAFDMFSFNNTDTNGTRKIAIPCEGSLPPKCYDSYLKVKKVSILCLIQFRTQTVKYTIE